MASEPDMPENEQSLAGLRKGANAEGSPRMIEARDRQRRALELRRAGATYEMIADQLDYKSVSGAAKAVSSALKLMLREPADEVRHLELDRLDRLLLAVWSRAIGGPGKPADDFAIDRALKVIKQRCELLGLNAPLRHEIGVEHEIVLDVVGLDVRPDQPAATVEHYDVEEH